MPLPTWSPRTSSESQNFIGRNGHHSPVKLSSLFQSSSQYLHNWQIRLTQIYHPIRSFKSHFKLLANNTNIHQNAVLKLSQMISFDIQRTPHSNDHSRILNQTFIFLSTYQSRYLTSIEHYVSLIFCIKSPIHHLPLEPNPVSRHFLIHSDELDKQKHNRQILRYRRNSINRFHIS